MDGIKKIVLTGPESSGKSILASELASHFKTQWAPEYARIFLETHGSDYTYPSLLQMAKAHKEHQAPFIGAASKLIFLDTDLINYKVWCNVVYHKTHQWIIDNINKEKDHSYLITYPDIEWAPDPLRENPNDRTFLFEQHLEEISNLKRPYRIVKGLGKQRLKNAIALAEELLPTL